MKVKKKLGGFQLDVQLKSDSKRIGILGASGCGKSMTLKSIAGIMTPDQGYIRVEDHLLYDSEKKKNVRPQKRKVGYLFQNYALFPTMTVGANIAAGLKGSKAEKARRVDEMITKFQLNGLKDRLPGELSGGQQQRVALARIMAYEPDMILLDEPFSALDEFLKDRLQQELMEMLEDYRGTVILVSHSRDEIYRFSDELVIMDNGRAICQGKTKDIFADPQWKEAARLTGCKNIVPVIRVNTNRMEIPEWGMQLKFLQREIPEEVRFIGVQAHDFIPVWKSKEETVSSPDISDDGQNRIAVIVNSMAELPFERKYFLKTAGKSGEICWFVQKDQWLPLDEKGVPDYLELPEAKILFLK